jgi:anti-sigma factor ChrR (cupin superfamily)
MNATRFVFPDLLAQTRQSDFQWEPMRPGIEIHKLCGDGEGPTSALLRYAPGATLPRHEHPGYEHIFVLEGTQADEHGVYAAPCFIVNPPGSAHDVRSPDGCIVLVTWQRPVRFT